MIIAIEISVNRDFSSQNSNPLFNEHNLLTLFENLSVLVKDNEKFKLPSNFANSIQGIKQSLTLIYSLDPSGDFFRYPMSKRGNQDNLKHQWVVRKRKDLEKEEGIKFSDLWGEEVATFQGNKLNEAIDAGREIAGTLFNLHFHVRKNICGGN